MPLQGKAKKVMESMRKTYGDDAESVFYATANKQNRVPETWEKKSAGERETTMRQRKTAHLRALGAAIAERVDDPLRALGRKVAEAVDDPMRALGRKVAEAVDDPMLVLGRKVAASLGSRAPTQPQPQALQQPQPNPQDPQGAMAPGAPDPNQAPAAGDNQGAMRMEPVPGPVAGVPGVEPPRQLVPQNQAPTQGRPSVGHSQPGMA